MYSPADTARHLARASIIAASSPALARYCLAVYHAGAVDHTKVMRANFAEDYSRKRAAEAADASARSSREHYAALGFGVIDFAADEAGVVATHPDPLNYRCNPAIADGEPWHGVSIRADDRTNQKPSRGWWLELHVSLPHCYGGQFGTMRKVETREEAEALAGKWVALGEAIVAADKAANFDVLERLANAVAC